MVSTPTILAIDLGKFHSVFCCFDVATKATTFRSVETTPANFRDAIRRQPGVTVVVEACSPAGWVHDLCEELGVPILVANTNADTWAWKNVKRKTDAVDPAGPVARAAETPADRPIRTEQMVSPIHELPPFGPWVG